MTRERIGRLESLLRVFQKVAGLIPKAGVVEKDERLTRGKMVILHRACRNELGMIQKSTERLRTH